MFLIDFSSLLCFVALLPFIKFNVIFLLTYPTFIFFLHFLQLAWLHFFQNIYKFFFLLSFFFLSWHILPLLWPLQPSFVQWYMDYGLYSIPDFKLNSGGKKCAFWELCSIHTAGNALGSPAAVYGSRPQVFPCLLGASKREIKRSLFIYF